MTSIISCVNLKGGVGKTALAVNFSAYCGMQGKKTLLIDLDPQTNATFSCIEADRWEQHAKKHGTVADLLGARSHSSAEGRQRTANEVLVKGVFRGVDLIPSHLDLFTIDLDLAGATARETRLRRAIQPIVSNYDIIICDCPPNLTIPTQNALAVSSHYVVPISPDFLSALGVGILVSRVAQLTTELENGLTHLGIVMSRVPPRATVHSNRITESLRKTFDSLVLDTEIKERTAVKVATEKQKSIFDTDDTKAKADFRSVSMDLLKRLGIS